MKEKGTEENKSTINKKKRKRIKKEKVAVFSTRNNEKQKK